MSDSNQKNPGQKKSDQKKSGKAKFAAPFIPGGIVAALLIASLVGYEVPVYSANIEEFAPASTADTDDTDAVTLPELTEQPDEESAAAADSIEPVSSVDESDAVYADGTYTGTGTGWGGTITVQVVIKNGLIASVTILSAPDETPEYFTKAKSITSAIVKAQSTNVDTVSGATYSSNGIIEAVRNALAKAGGSSSSSGSGGSSSGSKSSSGSGSSSSKTKAKALAAVDESDALYADGTWTGTGEGWGGDITVKVKIKNGVIKKIMVTDASDETPEYFNQAKAVITYIINGQTTNVDTVSGATFSSNGIIEAVRDALSKAAAAAGNTSGSDTDTADSSETTDTSGTEATTGTDSADTGSSSDTGSTGDSDDSTATSGYDDSSDSDDDTDETVHKYLDGTYTGTGEGWGGDIAVAVTISDDTITAIEILEAEDETAAFLKKATAVIDYILAAQSTDVDTVSGATYSSNGIIEAVSNALVEAEALAEAYYGSTDDSSDEVADAGGSSGSDDDADTGDSSGSDNDADDGDSSDTDDNADDSDDTSGSDDNEDTDDSRYPNDTDNSDDSDGSEENDDSDDIDGTTSGDSETDPDDSDVNADDDTDGNTDDDTDVDADDDADDDTDDTDDADDNGNDDADDSYTMLNGTYSIETTVYCDEWEDFYDYQISMLVTIESDAITAIDDITGDTDTTNQAYLKLAANGNKKYTGVVAQIIAAGNADDIDIVSGATCSSNAIIAGAKQAIEEATAAKASE